MILALHGIDSCITAYLIKWHKWRYAIVGKKLVWKLAPCVRYRNKHQVAKKKKKELSLIQIFVQDNIKKLKEGDVKSARYEVLTAPLLEMQVIWGRDAVSGEEFPTFRQIVLRSPSGSKERFTVFRNVVNFSPKDIAWQSRTWACPSLELASLLFGRTRHRWKD